MRWLTIVPCLVCLAACASSPPAAKPGLAAAQEGAAAAEVEPRHALDAAFLTYAAGADGERRDEFRGTVRTSSTAGGVAEELPVVIRDIGDGQLFLSWFEGDRAHGVQVIDLERRRVWTAAPIEGKRSAITDAELRAVGALDGGALDTPAPRTEGKKTLDPAWADETFFRGKWLEYTYENGKFFRNEFHGDLRHSKVKRGLLKELVVVRSLGAGKLFVSWVDERLGHVAQVIDLSRDVVWAAVPIGENTQIWRGQLAGSGTVDPDGKPELGGE